MRPSVPPPAIIDYNGGNFSGWPITLKISEEPHLPGHAEKQFAASLDRRTIRGNPPPNFGSLVAVDQRNRSQSFLKVLYYFLKKLANNPRTGSQQT